MPELRGEGLARNTPAVLLLAAQNLAIFAGHYLGKVGFPWDFNGTYYAVPAFWTSAVQNGILPRWVPFLAGGYPFALNLQSGFFYPPFWIFPALGVPFTLGAAVALQCLHVLLGAVGMYLLLRLALESPSAALIGAAAWQFFGGFYSNAEHADIVRAFALLPWLLFVLTRTPEDGGRLPARAFFLPLVLFLLATGGYPFNFLAALFVGTVYGAAEILRHPGGPRPASRPVALAAGYFALGALGVGMALVHLAPAWFHRDAFARWHHYAALPSTGIGLEHLPGLVFRSTALPGEISMTSTYVSLLLLTAVFMLPRARARRHAGFLLLLAAAAAMAPGMKSPIYAGVTRLVPALGVSRFPASDYRAFGAIALIALGVAALESVAHAEVSRRRLLIAGALAAAGLVWCAARVRGSVGMLGFAQAGASLVLSLALLAYAARRGRGLTGAVAVLALLLVFADGTRFVVRQETWRLHEPERALPPRAGSGASRDAVAPEVFRPPAARPPRVSAPAGNFAASGYLLGEFGDYEVESAVLEAKRLAGETDAYCEFLRRGWEAHLVALPSPGVLGSGGDLRIPGLIVEEPPALPGEVRQTRYGINEIRYAVNLPREALLVENELFFPGWRARRDGSGPAKETAAVRVNGIFRGWLLPAGRYDMAASFRFPGLMAFAAVSGFCACLWLSLLAVRWLRRRSASG